MIVQLLLLLILGPVVYLWWWQNERFKSAPGIPGPKPLPIFGNTFSFLFIKSEGTRILSTWTLTFKVMMSDKKSEFVWPDLFQVIIDLKEKYGKLYRLFIGDELWIVVSGAKDLEVSEWIN